VVFLVFLVAFFIANPDYEVVEAGRPCKLYFDLEFSRTANSGLQGLDLVTRLISLLIRRLHDSFGLRLSQAWKAVEINEHL
jgi:hypothetical protein